MLLLKGPRGDEADVSGTKTTRAAEASVELWSEKDRQQQIIHYKTPEFISPYPLDISIYAAKANKDTYDWLLEHGVHKIFLPKGYDRLVEADIPGLACRVYVNHGPQAIDWACKFFTWLFALDDQMDDTALGMQRGSSVAVFLELHCVFLWSFPEDPVLHENLMKFLDELPNSELREKSRQFINDMVNKAKTFGVSNAVYDGKLGPLASCLGDLWATCMKTMPEEYNLRLAHTIQDYYLGNLDEAKNREDKTFPSIEGYTTIRRKTGAVEPTIVITDLFEEAYLPNELFNSDPFQRLMDAINDFICWHNDLWSFQKEMRRADCHNLVFLISQERKYCSYEESSLIVLEMLYERITDLEKAALDLLAITSPAYEDTVRRYIKTCQNWVSGTQDWHMACCRYRRSQDTK